MRLGFDIDGVLCDFNTGYVERIKEVTGRNLFADPPVFDTWGYAEALGYAPDELNAVWDDIKADGHFWQTLPAYPDTPAIMQHIRFRHACGDDIYFITARPGATAKRETEQWLLKHQDGLHVFGPTVLMSAEKELCCAALRLDAYVDDRWQNARDVGFTSTESYLLTRPWNVQFCTPPHVTRIDGMDRFFETLPEVFRHAA